MNLRRLHFALIRINLEKYMTFSDENKAFDNANWKMFTIGLLNRVGST